MARKQSQSKKDLVRSLGSKRFALNLVVEENRRLREELSLERDQMVDSHASESMVKILEREDENLERRMLSLQETLSMHQIKYNEALERLDYDTSVNCTPERRLEEAERAQAKIEALEDRRHGALTNKGEAYSEFSEIKNEINNLRREKKLFESIETKKKVELRFIAKEAFASLKQAAKIVQDQEKTRQALRQMHETFLVEELACDSFIKKEEDTLRKFYDVLQRKQRKKAIERKEKTDGVLREAVKHTKHNAELVQAQKAYKPAPECASKHDIEERIHGINRNIKEFEALLRGAKEVLHTENYSLMVSILEEKKSRIASIL